MRPNRYNTDNTIRKLLNDYSRGYCFRDFLKNHNKFNVTRPTFSKCGVDELWAKTSKAGLEFLNRPGFPGECFICELRLPDHRF
ncbi:T3SS effector EspK [Escherichia coli]|nr:T3SS effector EspK [Escherichia coli]